MFSIEGVGRLLLIFGGVMVVLGLVFLLAGRGLPFLGRLPGDIVVQREGFTFYFPIVTMLVVSVVLTILLNVILRILR